MRFLGILAAVLLPGAVTLAADLAPIQEIEVVGTGSTTTNNSAAAFSRAEDAAIRQAVERVAEQLIGHDAVVSGYPLLKERVLKKPRRYLKEFRITSRIDKGSTVIVRMVCQITADVLARDLKAIGLMGEPATGLPKIAVLPDPKGGAGWWNVGGKKDAPAPITRALVTALRAKGFQVVEPRPPKKPLPLKAAVATIRKFAAAQKADAFVAVRWEIETSSADMDGVVYAATRVRLRSVSAISTKDGKRLAKVSGNGTAGRTVVKSLSDKERAALEAEALAQASEIIAGRLAAALGGGTSSPGRITLVVAGLGTFAEYVRFRQVLASQLKTVNAVTLIGAERGEMAFDVMLAKSPAAFADEVAAQDFSGFDVKVTERRDDRVVIHVKR